jgi:hypothetical protein
MVVGADIAKFHLANVTFSLQMPSVHLHVASQRRGRLQTLATQFARKLFQTRHRSMHRHMLANERVFTEKFTAKITFVTLLFVPVHV